MRYKLWLIGLLLVLGIVIGISMSGCMQQWEDESEYHELKIKNWAIQLQDANPNVIVTSGFEFVVIDYSRDGSEEGNYAVKYWNDTI